MVLASAGFAVMGVCAKSAMTHLPFHEVAFFRAFAGVIITLVLAPLLGISLAPRQPGFLLVRGLFGWTSLMCTFLAFSGLHLADATFLIQTSPFFTVALAGVFLGERLSVRVWACLGTAIVGVACVVGPQGGIWNWYALAALGAAFTASMAYMAVKRANASNSPWLIAAAFSVVSSALSLPFMLRGYQAPTAHEWALLAATGTVGTFAQIVMTYGYRYARASTASIFSLLTPLFSAVLAIAVFGVTPGWGTFLGGSLILAAGAWLFTAPPQPVMLPRAPTN
jgi:drug/metabolite transporter (DMT)-like permease